MTEATRSEAITIIQPPPPAIVQELSPVVAQAEAFQIVDVDSHGEALSKAKRLRDGERAIKDYFEDARKAADEAKKKILEARDGLIRPLTQARTLYDQKCLTFEEAERTKAKAEQARLEAEARKREEDRKLVDAAAAEDAGDHDQAASILAEPVVAPVVTVAPAVAKVEGVSQAVRYSAETFDLKKLVMWAAQDVDNRVHYLEAAQTVLNREAVSRREALNIPGVRVVKSQHRRYGS